MGECDKCPMLFLWFDHPLIEVWLERQLAASRLTISHDGAASAPPQPPQDARREPPRSTVRHRMREQRGKAVVG